MAETGAYWFRPKRYGYGAEPKSWQGWLATGLFVAAVALIAWFGMVEPAVHGQQVSTIGTILMWSVLIAMTAGFVWFCHQKTDGRWRWRWGRDD